MSTKNVIPDRIADAMRQYPPFSLLPPEAVRELAAHCSVRVLPAGEQLWKQGESLNEEVLFLARGRVEYLWADAGRSQRVDIRDVGDVLGLTALLRGEPFRVTAQVVEDSLFYGLPAFRLKRLIEANDAARHYARRHQFWLSRTGTPLTNAEPPQSEAAVPGRAKNILQAHLDGARLVQIRPADRLLTCTPETTVAAAATAMTTRGVPSILVVDAARQPLGIVTASRLVRRIIVEGLDQGAPVSAAMSSPVITIAPRTTATAAILLMLRERINQVCVTEDGTTASAAVDVCSQKDLLAQSGHHPAGLLREIRLAQSPARFRELCDEIEGIARSYLEAGVSAIYVGQICAELYDELLQRLLTRETETLAALGTPLPARPWAWLSVGSDGRREQILRTDMDNALVFAGTGSPAEDEAARQRFLRFAAGVIDGLAAAGFARCQGGVMALNPRWCRTEIEWLAEFGDGAALGENDGLLRAAVLCDLRHVAGDKALCASLRSALLAAAAQNRQLQLRLAEQVVDTAPPLNFIGRFVVETFGGGSGEFDLKARGLAPLRDAARVLSIKHGLYRRYSTGGRWEELGQTIPRLTETAALAREAYDFLLRLRTLNGVRRGDSGRHLDPLTLTKLERAQLANIFDVVRSVQGVVREEFHLEVRRL